MVPVPTMMRPIGLVTLGQIFRVARGSPEMVGRTGGAIEAIAALRSFAESDEGGSLGASAAKLDPSNPGLTSEGLLEIREVLIRDEPLRSRLLPCLRSGPVLFSPGILEAVIRRDPRVRDGLVGQLLLPLIGGAMKAYPEDKLGELVEALKELQRLQLISGMALVYETAREWAKAGLFYEWYLVMNEQLEGPDPSWRGWGLQRLAVVFHAGGKANAAARVEGLPREVERYLRIRGDLYGLDPGDDDFVSQLEFVLTTIPRGLTSWVVSGVDFFAQMMQWVDGLEQFAGVCRSGGIDRPRRGVEFALLREAFPRHPYDSSPPPEPMEVVARVELDPLALTAAGDGEAIIELHAEDILPLVADDGAAPAPPPQRFALTPPPAGVPTGFEREHLLTPRGGVTLADLIKATVLKELREMNRGDTLILSVNVPEPPAFREEGGRLQALLLEGDCLTLLEGKTILLKSPPLKEGWRYRVQVTKVTEGPDRKGLAFELILSH